MGADEITTLTYRLARQAHRLLIISSDELGVGGNAAIDRRERVARAQPPRAASGLIGVLPAAAVGQDEAIIALGQREIWIEA